MKTILLTQDKETQVSDEDFNELSHWDWQYLDVHSNGNGYAVRRGYIGCKPTLVYMHKMIASDMGLPANLLIAHSDGNNLNNQRDNLEAITHSQHAINNSTHRNKYRGVSKDGNVYRAMIQHEGVTYTLGSHASDENAAKLYDVAALHYHGQNAKLNFPDDAPTLSLDNALHQHKRDKALTDFKAKKRTTPYVGVSAHGNNYRAAIRDIDGKTLNLGHFATAELGAKAYDRESVRIYGVHAFVNFPKSDNKRRKK